MSGSDGGVGCARAVAVVRVSAWPGELCDGNEQMTRLSITALALCAVLGQPARAHADNTADVIIVTALRDPVDADQVAASVTVLDQSALQRAQPLALTDVLVRTPGITVARNGGYGQVTSLRIRGANPAESVVVIDGMRMADATAIAGGFDFSQLYTDDIARVEVLRGPQSVLWGSDAIGGVVHVTTAAPNRPLAADWAVEGGSHETVNGRAGLGGTSALADWRLSGSAFSTGGIPTLTGGTEPNGYARQALSGTVTVRLSPALSLDLRGFWDKARTSYSDQFSLPGAIYGGNFARNSQWSVYAGLNATYGQVKQRVSVQQDQTDNTDTEPLQDPALVFIGRGQTRRYEYQATITPMRAITLLAGAEREEALMRVGSPYDAIQPYALVPQTAITNSGYGAVRIIPLPGLTLNAGLRHDHHSQFGGNTVLSAGVTYSPDQGATVLRAAYGEGFKAPSLYQLTSDYGNAALRPERAHGWEAGLSSALLNQAVHIGAAWWQRDTTQLIDFALCDYPVTAASPAACRINGYGYYANVARAAAHGLELTAQARIGHAFAESNTSIVVSRDRTPGAATFDRQLPRVPRQLFNATLGYDWPGGLTTSIAVRASGAAFDRSSSTAELPAYSLIDCRAEYRLSPHVTLFGRIENTTDRRYQTAAGYNSLGRTVMIGLRGHIG